MKRIITAFCVVAASASVAAQNTTTSPAGSQAPQQQRQPQAEPTTQPQPPAQTQSVQTNPARPNEPGGQSGKPLTITGCLQPAQNGQNAFQLIVPDSKQSTTNAKGVTTTYALTPSGQVDFQGHLNEMVEVTGSELPTPPQTATVVDQAKTTAEPAGVGTSGRAASGSPTGAPKTTPTVETTAKAEIVAKAMSVTSIKTVATKCP